MFIFVYLFHSEYLINVILFNEYTKEFVYLFLIIYFLTINVNKQKDVAQVCVCKRRPIPFFPLLNTEEKLLTKPEALKTNAKKLRNSELSRTRFYHK